MTGTSTTPGVDHRTLMWDETADIGDLLDEIDDRDLDAPSLCDGWRVRDVIGHMLYGHTTPIWRIAADMARFRGDVERGSFERSRALAGRCSPAELRGLWAREIVEGHARRGISRLIPSKVAFVDHLIHHQDIRRPLGRPRHIPGERLRAALDLLPVIRTSMFATRPKVRGLRLEATDVGWAWGAGPLVAGPGEALVMACGGRRVALADLRGDGVAVLAGRLG
jgi:uncharacterized protein (TIGR03083 family)